METFPGVQVHLGTNSEVIRRMAHFLHDMVMVKWQWWVASTHLAQRIPALVRTLALCTRVTTVSAVAETPPAHAVKCMKLTGVSAGQEPFQRHCTVPQSAQPNAQQLRG